MIYSFNFTINIDKTMHKVYLLLFLNTYEEYIPNFIIEQNIDYLIKIIGVKTCQMGKVVNIKEFGNKKNGWSAHIMVKGEK